jgi:hypothetical protein
MGFRFYRRLPLIPGVRLNLTTRGNVGELRPPRRLVHHWPRRSAHGDARVAGQRPAIYREQGR